MRQTESSTGLVHTTIADRERRGKGAHGGVQSGPVRAVWRRGEAAEVREGRPRRDWLVAVRILPRAALAAAVGNYEGYIERVKWQGIWED